jgi:hypothetical protein
MSICDNIVGGGRSNDGSGGRSNDGNDNVNSAQTITVQRERRLSIIFRDAKR